MTTPEVRMRLGGNLLELSCVDGPLPAPLLDELQRQLTYTHLTHLRGPEAYDRVTGHYVPVRAEQRLLYRMDSRGRLVCGLGFQYRLLNELQRLGIQTLVEDVRTQHPRTDRYTVDWDRVFHAIEELRYRQDELLAVMETVEHGRISAPPGFGKTWSFLAYALAHPRSRIHIVVDGIDIMQRIYRFLVRYIANVGFVGGGKDRWGEHVTVLSADSLHKVGEGFDDPCSHRAADTVLADEAHKLAASSVLPNLARYQHCRMYGFSATHGQRFDGSDAALESLFGSIIFHMSYQEAEANGLVVPISVEWVKMNFERNPAEDYKTTTAKERWGLWQHQARNERLAERVLQIPDDEQVLVMVRTLEHAVNLKQCLPGFKLCYDQLADDAYDRYVRNHMLDPADEPPMTPQRRERMRQDFEAGRLLRVIATDVWSTGVDFASLSVLVRADGRGSAILDYQIPGRVSRVAEGKDAGLVIDCYDEFDRSFLNKSNLRKRNYVRNGWTMVGLTARRPNGRPIYNGIRT